MTTKDDINRATVDVQVASKYMASAIEMFEAACLAEDGAEQEKQREALHTLLDVQCDARSRLFVTLREFIKNPTKE